MSVLMSLRAARVELMADIEELRDTELRMQVMDAAVIQFGGKLIRQQNGTNWGPQHAQIELLGVSGFGGTEEAAIADWCAAVTRMEIAMQEEERVA